MVHKKMRNSYKILFGKREGKIKLMEDRGMDPISKRNSVRSCGLNSTGSKARLRDYEHSKVNFGLLGSTL